MQHSAMKWLILLLSVVLMCLSACSRGDMAEPTTEVTVTEDPKLLVTEYALIAVNEPDLAALDIYPNLTSLDLRGSTCYDAILSYIASHPQVSVLYDVQFGGTAYGQNTTELTLNDGEFDYMELLTNLAYLPKVTSVDLPRTSLSAVELTALTDAYPGITITYSIMLLEEEISQDVTQLDLSWLEPAQVEFAAAALTQLSALTDIQLMNVDGTSALTVSDVKILMDAAPDATVHYTFNLFGKTVSTTDERIEFDRVTIKNSGVEQIRAALDILPNCTYLLMDQCGVDNEVMAQLREDYPDTKIVWRISYAGRSCLTDVTVFRCVGDLTNGNSKDLKYCTDIEYLDIGHCFNLSDLSFVSYMPNLKVAIVVDCCTTSLEPFAACTNLEYLEIVNCNGVKDLSPLANCVNLKGLNMSYVFSVEDLSPLYGLEKLERLFMGRNDFSEETIAEARAALPNCWVTDHAESVAWIGFNYSVGWRLDDEHTFAEWYKEIKEIFGYDREIY